uniref:Protein kinase domain-containing protein n=1 Tax=Oreochromis aureus TaxID=47969 RepID=A0AAZ1XKI6_OREAU
TDQQFQYETGYESLETRYLKLKSLDDLEQVMMFTQGPENGQRLFVSLIKQMLALDANQRITPSEVLQHPFFDPKSSLCIDTNGERVCLKFELLDQCLWDYIRDRNKQGLPISEFRPILGQLTSALSHLGSVGIVHADLKPGNIMVVNRHESPVKVKLIDFGLACPASAVNPSDSSDMWSLGLVAVELGTGVPLYPGNEDYDVLKFIIETQGQPPDHVLDSGFTWRRGFGIVAKCRDTKPTKLLPLKSTRAALMFSKRQNWKFSSWSSCEVGSRCRQHC